MPSSLLRAYLSGSVDDLYGEILVLVLDDLGEGVLNGGVVRIDKVAVDELNSQRALACDMSVGCYNSGSITFSHSPTDLLPTMAILRCFCCGGIVSELFLYTRRGLVAVRCIVVDSVIDKLGGVTIAMNLR